VDKISDFYTNHTLCIVGIIFLSIALLILLCVTITKGRALYQQYQEKKTSQHYFNNFHHLLDRKVSCRELIQEEIIRTINMPAVLTDLITNYLHPIPPDNALGLDFNLDDNTFVPHTNAHGPFRSG